MHDLSAPRRNDITAAQAATSRPWFEFRRVGIIPLAAAIAGAGMDARAQTTPTEVVAQTAPTENASPGGHLTLGLAAAYLPRYEGSDDYRVRALPLIDYRNGRFFAGVLTGIGYDFSPVSNVAFGPLLSYRMGRDQDDADRLHGLGDVDGGADLGAFVRWNLRPFFVRATVKQGISGDATGTQIRLGAGYATTLEPADRLVLDASVDWADSEVMQTYFGITAAQSVSSGLAGYTADAGIRRYGLGATWTHTFTPQWFSTVGVGVYRLGSEAANSPITLDRNAGTVSAGFGYRF